MEIALPRMLWPLLLGAVAPACAHHATCETAARHVNTLAGRPADADLPSMVEECRAKALPQWALDCFARAADGPAARACEERFERYRDERASAVVTPSDDTTSPDVTPPPAHVHAPEPIDDWQECSGGETFYLLLGLAAGCPEAPASFASGLTLAFDANLAVVVEDAPFTVTDRDTLAVGCTFAVRLEGADGTLELAAATDLDGAVQGAGTWTPPSGAPCDVTIDGTWSP